jgi:hypothetical protein
VVRGTISESVENELQEPVGSSVPSCSLADHSDTAKSSEDIFGVGIVSDGSLGGGPLNDAVHGVEDLVADPGKELRPLPIRRSPPYYVRVPLRL